MTPGEMADRLLDSAPYLEPWEDPKQIMPDRLGIPPETMKHTAAMLREAVELVKVEPDAFLTDRQYKAWRKDCLAWLEGGTA